MHTLNDIFAWVGTYPIAAVALAIAVAVIGAASLKRKRKQPQISPPIPQPSNGEGSVFMKLKAIQLLPENPELDLQIIAYVNGMEFHYPSIDKSKWISMSHNTSAAIIELPDAELYRIHLAVHCRSGETLEGGPAVVRRTLLQTPAKPRFNEEYKLYLLENGRRDTSLKAVIPYEFYIQ